MVLVKVGTRGKVKENLTTNIKNNYKVLTSNGEHLHHVFERD